MLLGAEATGRRVSPAVRRWAAEALVIDVPLLGLGRGALEMAELLGAIVGPAALPEAGFLAVDPGAPGIAPGAAISLIGPPGSTPDDLAERAGTIGYEVLTSLGRRYRREYRTA